MLVSGEDVGVSVNGGFRLGLYWCAGVLQQVNGLLDVNVRRKSRLVLQDSSVVAGPCH